MYNTCTGSGTSNITGLGDGVGADDAPGGKRAGAGEGAVSGTS